MRKIGIYGGTFDPIHYAHLILAREAREQLGLEKVIFVPAAVSPFRDAPLATGDIRLRMLRAAIEGEPDFVADDCDLRRPPPSYTFDTVTDIRRREGEADFHYMLGEDNVAGLPRWNRVFCGEAKRRAPVSWLARVPTRTRGGSACSSGGAPPPRPAAESER